MHWIAPSEKDQDNAALEKRLWDSADQFRANSGLKANAKGGNGNLPRRGSRVDEPAAYHAEGILDPACGSGGMFVSSARFVAEHKQNPSAERAIHGIEKTNETGRLCRLNLAVHGLEGDIPHGGQVNSYYDDPHKATGQFDYVLANPPFNANAVDKEAEGLLNELLKRDR